MRPNNGLEHLADAPQLICDVENIARDRTLGRTVDAAKPLEEMR